MMETGSNFVADFKIQSAGGGSPATTQTEPIRIGHIEEQLAALSSACDELEKAWATLSRLTQVPMDPQADTSSPVFDTFESIYQRIVHQSQRVRAVATQIAMRA